MARSIVKEEQSLRTSLSQAIEDINRMVYLSKQVVGCEPSIPILARAENDSGFAGKP